MNGTRLGAGLREKLDAVFKGKHSRTLLFVGIAGMALIFLSTVIQTGGSNKPNPSVGAGQLTSQEYVAQLEERLTGIVGSIEGVGRCQVMVTAESGVEYVYAVEETQNVNRTNSYNGDEVARETQQENTEQKYIVVDAGNGKKEALVKTERQPAIQGVVIVCEGAGSMVVQERVTQVVTTALGIPYNKVCVTKLSK
ncbi:MULTISPECIES: hypothetical protein [Anaerotruncus]|uniref:Stage III sporulation protein AG n=1 Tax=Anaerotruncus massiliensis (ex Togo et al. 2019) TaxID=1673720 RepID=A0ABR7AAH4_9FIRM|nr:MULTISPECIES: hypothetical protein [Anaerotruncus]MBC3937453.1 hypothetical protein [Anaerotruncus massiliensis (ex Togo et al. 2019)]MCQ4894510.1 hypothetical protein [Anaerotruncus sp. DFI.9.16]